MSSTESSVAYAPYYIAFVALYILALVSRNIRRAAVHPLNRYPGPWITKVSDCYAGYQAIKHRTHKDIHQLHLHYGPIVRYGPNRLVFNTIAAFNDIYRNPRMSKSQEYAKGTIAGRHYVFSVIDGETHRQKRQVVSQALNDVSIRRHQSAIVDQVDIFLDKILKSSQGRNGGTNMTEHCMLLSVDIIAILALGQTLNVQTDGIKRRALKPLFMPETIFNVILHWPRLSFLKGIAEILLSSRKKAFRKTIKNLIEERLIRGNDGYDLLSFIPKELAHGFDGFRGSDLWSELLFFLKAGSGPPAAAMCGVFFYLSRNARCYDILSKEIRSRFSSSDEIDLGPRLRSCAYLRACIDETLRMSPPALATMWREQDKYDENKSPIIIDGQAIHKGTVVGVNAYAIHHNKEYFPEPYIFRPERWLHSSSEKSHSSRQAHYMQRQAFIPFVAGNRSCVGTSLAYLEISLVIAKTLWHFDFKKTSGELGKIGEESEAGMCGSTSQGEFRLHDAF